MSSIITPLRYPGGKSRALKIISPYFPETISEFREPMVGGGSVYIHLRQKYPNAKFWINDKYFNLYCFWMALRDNTDALTFVLTNLKNKYSTPESAKDLHAKFRSEIDSMGTEVERAIAFFVLNKCSYSGLTEIGTFSPQASDNNFTLSTINKLKAIGKLLQGTRITNSDYSVLLEEPGEQAFIYLDPPYDILDQKRQNALYGKDGTLHKQFDHLKFFEHFKQCTHKSMVTYNSSDVLKERYSNFRVIEWQAKYGMQWKKESGKNKAQVKSELLVLNYNS